MEGRGSKTPVFNSVCPSSPNREASTLCRDTFTWDRGRRLPAIMVQLREKSSQALERACSPHGLSILPHPPGLSHRPECGPRRPKTTEMWSTTLLCPRTCQLRGLDNIPFCENPQSHDCLQAECLKLYWGPDSLKELAYETIRKFLAN